MNGIKISANGSIRERDPAKFSVDSEHPLWLCDLRSKPKHFGLIQCAVSSLVPGAKRTILSMNHRYILKPSFIVQWYFPAGTHPGHSDDQKYGIGTFDAFISGTNLVTFTTKVTGTLFTIEVENGSASTLTNLYAEFRYYIFAQPFKLLTDE